MTKTNRSLYTIILVLTLILFMYKGVQYLLLGSYLPIIFSLGICMLFYFNRNRKKTLNTLIKVWAILMIIWSILRIIIGLTDRFGKELMENHLQENLGIKGIIVSFLFLAMGLFLLSKKKRTQWIHFS